MFARIFPIVRLPRKFAAFDYSLPDALTLQVGDLVAVPFHHRTVVGIVAEVRATTSVMGQLQSVQHVVIPAALSPADITRICSLAQRIAQSPSTIFFHALGLVHDETVLPRMVAAGAHDHRLPRELVGDVQQTLELLRAQRHVCAQLSTEASLAAVQLLRRNLSDQLLIVTPRERDAELYARSITLGKNTAILHGRTSPKERGRIFRAWRDGRVQTLVGTRQAALLPAQRLSAVVVANTGVDDHFNDRKNPRLDTRLLAEAQARQHGAYLLLCDPLPRPEEVAAFPCAYSRNQAAVQVVDLRMPEEQRPSSLLSETLVVAVKKALQSQKKVLLFYNRKGLAKRAQCKSCGHVVLCATCGAVPVPSDRAMLTCHRCLTVSTVPDQCPACQHGKVGLKGMGNAHVAADLLAVFPTARIGRVEKGHVDEADILVVTEYFFSSVLTPFAPKSFGLVADVCADLSFAADNFRGAEEGARKLHRLAAFAQQQGAECIVQTWLPDVIDGMRDAQRFLTDESTLRSQYALPPYAALVTVRHADAQALQAVTGLPFAADDEQLGCVARVTYPQLDACLAALATLPDTAVISINYTYVNHYRPPQPQS